MNDRTALRDRLQRLASAGFGDGDVRTIRAVPLKLDGKGKKGPPTILEVRGEAYMERSDFAALNASRVAASTPASAALSTA